MWFNQYPYINLTDLNLDDIYKSIKELRYQLENFININTIKYANPIQWNITKQYEANTVVIDANDGTAYLSVKPVPSGVAITNTDFWTPIFTLNLLSANQNITLRDDGANVLATFGSVAGDWLIWNNTLYKVTQIINVNEAYVVGYNLTRYTVELFIDDLESNINSQIAAIISDVGDLTALNTTNKTDLVSAINEVLSKTNSLNIYNIADYDIVDDGTDQYAKFINLMAIVNTNGGGIIYVPKGHYITSNTIPIPSNTIIFGDGIESEIYFDGTDPYMGTTIMPAGDNILVTNLSLEYYEADKTEIKLGSQLGSIGITNRRFVANEDAKNFPNGTIKNITFDRIFSTNTHPYNIEPETTANIDNCTLSNCNFENGEIYINPLSPADSIHNAKVTGCSSKGLVIGSGYNTNGSIFICNCYTHYARFTDVNIIVDNLQLDALSYARGGTTPSYSMQINGDSIVLNNVRVINNGEAITNGVSIGSAAGNSNVFNNVAISGYTVNYYDNVGRVVRFTNCDFGNSELSYIRGIIRNSNIKPAQNADCNIDYTRVATITLGTNLAFNGNSDVITSHESVIAINGVIDSSKTLVETSSLGTVPTIYRPSATRYMVAFFVHSGAYYPIVFEVATNGTIFVNKLFGQNVVSGDTIYIDSEYML